MAPPANATGRPSGYPYAPQQPQQQQLLLQQQLQQQQQRNLGPQAQGQRGGSPLPPPIQTGNARGYGHPQPTPMYNNQQPPLSGPPGYAPPHQQNGYGGGYAGNAPQPYMNNPMNNTVNNRQAAEVEGGQRNKTQLIVGIDFVRCSFMRVTSILSTYTISRGRHFQEWHLRLQPPMRRRRSTSSLNGLARETKQSKRYVRLRKPSQQ